jgi:hypothetical protein
LQAVQEAICAVNRNIALPAGYHLEWAGEYEKVKTRLSQNGKMRDAKNKSHSHDTQIGEDEATALNSPVST